MDNQTVLIAALVVLVVVLSVLLVRRFRYEKQQLEAIRRMNLDEFSDFLRSNSVEGNISEVAHKVSDLLETAFGCDLILFLRKKRQYLEVNFVQGLPGGERGNLRIVATPSLLAALATEFRPRPLGRLRGLLPVEYAQRLEGLGFDLYFPVFWRENLYGVYFVRSTLETRSASFHLLVASLAQSLSAAYHIKWHESRYQLVREQLDRMRSTTAPAPAERRSQSNLLRLVNHRTAQTLMPRLVESLRKDLGLEGVAYLYQPNGAAEPQVIHEGLPSAPEAPDRQAVEGLMRSFRDEEIYPLSRFSKEPAGLRDWFRSLRDSGLEYVTLFPSLHGKQGVLAFGGPAAAKAREQIDALRGPVRDLISNVETYERIQEMSQTDALTGLANQRYFRRRLEEESLRAKRYRRNMALIFFDLDGLKQTNDTYGHLAGDAVIRHIGRVLRNHIRSIDIIARYGGDEFCIIMPEADRTTCGRFMERLKDEVAKAQILVSGAETPITTTISLGGAVFPDHAETPHQLIFAADMALLRAKEQGRNKSVLYDETAGAAE